MPFKYLYIDDEKLELIEAMISSITSKSQEQIEISHTQVLGSLGEAINYIQQNQDSFQGIIIDQDLKAESETGKKADYYGTTLAQQLRTNMAIARADRRATVNIKTMPLVLMSNEDVIVQSFEPDDSSKNLFDYVVSKTSLRAEQAQLRTANVLSALVSAYDMANHCYAVDADLTDNEICEILQVGLERLEFIDSRFIDYIRSKASDPHALVGSIYSSLVQSAGMLVTEEMLKTKLGVFGSSLDWDDLKEKHFKPYVYQGVFSEIKERWWFSGIEDWWYKIHPEDVLQSLSAKERVEVLSNKLGYKKLEAISTRYPGDESEYYWVNCVLSGLPLDPFDGLRVRDPDAKPWEQVKYLDLKSFKTDTSEKYTVHSDDRPKVRLLLARLKPDVND
ncbi:protein-PII uridylyltransferase [Pseudoalteromonas phenolica]|uniref:protein-PII uridylyltransferase n=1 Tax=Pseudoalteromonas phenolica TaxID=161398 RepID=UPI00110A9DFC|nr:protein-PII uridylyltransferase [Pseudoalteromonas phenolica]TMO53471.1 protein-PII uridylyltransferase [Pseudoalteromonas phenolica]